MASPAQILANAERSTGPRSAGGKLRTRSAPGLAAVDDEIEMDEDDIAEDTEL